jgi:hypothetical protein
MGDTPVVGSVEARPNGKVRIELKPVIKEKSTAPPTFESLMKQLRDGELVVHSTRLPLTKSNVLGALCNSQRDEKLNTGWSGGWNVSAQARFQKTLAGEKRSRVALHEQPVPLALRDQPAQLALRDQPAPLPLRDALHGDGPVQLASLAAPCNSSEEAVPEDPVSEEPVSDAPDSSDASSASESENSQENIVAVLKAENAELLDAVGTGQEIEEELCELRAFSAGMLEENERLTKENTQLRAMLELHVASDSEESY